MSSGYCVWQQAKESRADRFALPDSLKRSPWLFLVASQFAADFIPNAVRSQLSTKSSRLCACRTGANGFPTSSPGARLPVSLKAVYVDRTARKRTRRYQVPSLGKLENVLNGVL